MSYTLQYGQILPYLPDLLDGAWLTVQIAFVAFFGGYVIGTAGAAALSFGAAWARRAVRAYVVAFTNTPQLVQIYFLVFALPEWGIVLSPLAAVVIGMMLNAGAYLTEIQRAGFASRRLTEMEAAETLNFSRWQQIHYVVLPHVARTLFPPLSNQFIIMILGSSMASVFGVEELTGRTLNVNSATFRSIEIFTLAALIYVVLTLIMSAGLRALGRVLFRVKARGI